MNAKEQKFMEIIRRHERTLYTVCYMFSEDKDEVDDLYQDILVRLWQGFDAFEGRSDVKTWIYRVSLNCCINFSRQTEEAAGGFPSRRGIPGGRGQPGKEIADKAAL